MGWDRREGKAEEAEGERREPGRYLGEDGGTAGPDPPQEGWDPSRAWSVRSSISSSTQAVFPLCRLVLCSFSTDLLTVAFFISVVLC